MDLYDKVVKAKIFIDENYLDPLNLDAICDTACFSKFHFIRLFKKIYKKTPHRYLSERRIEYAKTRIASTMLPVNAICLEAGFQSVTSFCIRFKELTGKTPGEYREQARIMRMQVAENPEAFVPDCFSFMFSK